MKNKILNISSLVAVSIILLISCKKNETTFNNDKQANETKLTSGIISIADEDLTDEMLTYVDTLTLTDEDGNVVKLLATANEMDIINEYRDSALLAFEILNKGDMDTMTTTIDSSIDYSAFPSIPAGDEGEIHFYVIESPANSAQLILFKSGPRYKVKEQDTYPRYKEMFSDLGQYAYASYVTGPFGIEIQIEAKDCGWCNRYFYTPYIKLYNAFPNYTYNRPSAKRMWVWVYSNNKNRTVAIW